MEVSKAQELTAQEGYLTDKAEECSGPASPPTRAAGGRTSLNELRRSRF